MGVAPHIKKLFRQADMPQPKSADDAALRSWYDLKSKLMEQALGPEHETVLHAILSYEVGGPLHTYFYHQDIDGTGIASKQLARLEGDGPSNNTYKSYEFVMFSREAWQSPPDYDVSYSQQGMIGHMRAVINAIAPYSEEATLEPGHTLEFPQDYGHELGGRCFIFDAYKPDLFDKSFGLLLIMELHRDEMEFARAQTAPELFKKLKNADAYPYSDLDRPSVLKPLN